MCRLRILFAFTLAFSNTLTGQVQVNGYFTSDSVKIGQPTQYILKAQYPKEMTILFPDSTFDFSPFEIHRKRFFPTVTSGNTSTDSAIYWLNTYEIDLVQHLALPIFVVHPQDCTVVWAKPDSLFLHELVAQVPDSVSAEELPLKTNTAYQRVSWIFNYPLALIIIGSILLLSLLGWIFFRKQIGRYFRLRKLGRNHQQFLEKYRQVHERLEESFSRPLAEDAMSIWKKYMEGLVGEPYTKFTTKELRQLIDDKQLIETLRQIDVMVYSHTNAKELGHFHELRKHAEEAFVRKQDEIKHG